MATTKVTRASKKQSNFYTLQITSPTGEVVGEIAVPRVTHVLDSVLAKPKLMYWYYKQAITGLSTLLAQYGGALPHDIKSLHSLMTQHGLSPYAIRDAAGNRGTKVHKNLETLAGGHDVAITPQNKCLVEWFRYRKPDVIATEETLVSMKHRFAGTTDIVYRSDVHGGVILADVKTGKHVDWSHFLQLAAYQIAWEENGGDPIDRLSIIHAPSLGGAWREVVNSPQRDLRSTFLQLLEVYNSLPLNWHPEDMEELES